MTRNIATVLTVVFLLTLVGPVVAQNVTELIIADFDKPPPSNIGGTWGIFARSGDEKTYTVRDLHDDKIAYGDVGASMRLDYNVQKRESFNGFWVKLGAKEYGNDFDASEYRKLTFWVKGDKNAGIPKAVKVELKSGDKGGTFYIRSLKSDWKQYSIPLSRFKAQKVDLEKLNEVVIVFEHSAAKPATKGRIWLDSLAFKK